MKSNIIKTIARPNSVFCREEKDYRVTRPHYFPSKQILNQKLDIKPNSLDYFSK